MRIPIQICRFAIGLIVFTSAAFAFPVQNQQDSSEQVLEKSLQSRDIWPSAKSLMIEGDVKLLGLKAGDLDARFLRISQDKNMRTRFTSSIFAEASGITGGISWHTRNEPEKPFQLYKLEYALSLLESYPGNLRVKNPQGEMKPRVVKTEPLSKEEKGKLSKAGINTDNVVAVEDGRIHSFVDERTQEVLVIADKYWAYEFSDYQPFEDKIFPRKVRVLKMDKPVIEMTLRLSRPEIKAEVFIIPQDAEKIDTSCGQGTKAGKLIRNVRPAYPFGEGEVHFQGEVAIFMVIGADGKVHSPFVIAQPNEGIGDAVLQAVRKWEYSPFTICGQPVEAATDITMHP